MMRCVVILLGTLWLELLVASGAGVQNEQARPARDTGSARTAEEAGALVQFHNKARAEVGVGSPRGKFDRLCALHSQPG